MPDQLEGRNPVLECLTRGKRRVHHIWLDTGAKEDERVGRILSLAAAKGTPVERVERAFLDRKAEGRVHNGVVASVDTLSAPTTKQLIDRLFEAGEAPFLVLADGLAYEHNLGAILRSALGFGAHAVIVPTRRGAAVSPVVQRVAMGAAEEIPVIHEGLSSALKHIRKAGIPVVGADMGGVSLGQARLSGALAVVMGAEGSGLSPTLAARCDQIVSIPLAGGLESLNVSVATAVLMYEKRRQDGWFPDSEGG
ncbi:MAG: 23S rRNA (guanosine(2251)-2'-O)-methyltransferase RlmB [Deltaproteobacteria bacterium]|nr:23S rRNA (guanosine(2251)-2'-O)-methyltransferase RlmB [Deltaproteobacteria bacterium]